MDLNLDFDDIETVESGIKERRTVWLAISGFNSYKPLGIQYLCTHKIIGSIESTKRTVQ